MKLKLAISVFVLLIGSSFVMAQKPQSFLLWSDQKDRISSFSVDFNTNTWVYVGEKEILQGKVTRVHRLPDYVGFWGIDNNLFMSGYAIPGKGTVKISAVAGTFSRYCSGSLICFEGGVGCTILK